MKTKIILLSVILLCSCAGVKKTTRSEIKSDVKTNTEVKKTSEENASLTTSDNTEKKTERSDKKNTSVEENSNESSKTHTINYDPNAPVDPVTNRRPVASETFEETNKNNHKKAEESTETLYSQAEVQSLFQVYFKISQHTSDSVNKVISTLKSEVREQTKKADYWWVWLIVGISLPVIGWIAMKSGWPAKVFVLVLNLFKKI